ncbi:MAG: alpha/beta fold hydrolase BchO [Gemmatimonadaceae bacterium]
MSNSPSWNDLKGRWPNAEFSRFVDAGGLHWHVQVFGSGPALLLLHGSGAATHSWRDVATLLAKQFTVVAPDLPGHGFTSRPDAKSMSLAGMATALDALLRRLDVVPETLVGHSAGGALALWMTERRPSATVVGINAALAPPNALMTFLTPGVQLLVGTALFGFLTAKLAESDTVFDALMSSTGSTIDALQMNLYRTFARSPEHTGALMTMFSNWDLNALSERLPRIKNPVTLIVGANDGWVPPADTRRMARLLPCARIVTIEGAGHLAHEEFPLRVVDIIADSATRTTSAGDTEQV